MPLSTAQLLILKRALRTVPAGTRLQEPVVAATAEEAGLTQEQTCGWDEFVGEKDESVDDDRKSASDDITAQLRSDLAREVEAHKETRREAADERIAMATAYNKQTEVMTKEFTKQIERLTMHNEDMAKQWAEERERMTKQWEKERGRYIAAAAKGSGSKRARV